MQDSRRVFFILVTLAFVLNAKKIKFAFTHEEGGKTVHGAIPRSGAGGA
jgi:hypothetical protein